MAATRGRGGAKGTAALKVKSTPPSPTAAPVRKPALESTAQRLHPVQVEFSWPLGVRLDVERTLPLDLDEDPEEWLETFSSPPEWIDRLAPLSAMFNAEKLTGKNPLEIELLFLQRLTTDLTRIGVEMERVGRERFGERGAVSFLGLGLDPDTIARVIEYDYETADNSYSRFDTLVGQGFVTPICTTPFHTLLTNCRQDFELRLLFRIALDFYWPLLRKYNRAVLRKTGEKLFTAVFWLPEGAFSARILELLHQEFTKRCEAESIEPAHLILLLDTEQSKESEIEVLMKRWNTLRPSAATRDTVSIMFRERAFSDWVIRGHPSTKKQLDRTIAKVDAVLRDSGKDHLWAHFEPLGTLLSTFKTNNNFEQKLLKLTELGYQPAGPDVFIRRKHLRLYGMEESEPRRTTLLDRTCWTAHEDTPGSLSRFTGVEDGATPALAPNRPYERRVTGGMGKMENGNPCWKPALWESLQAVHRAVVGEPKTFIGGMLGLLRERAPAERIPTAMRNVEDFLVLYSRIRWKEHFIHHGISEADIQLSDYCAQTLLRDAPDDADLTDEDMALCGVAAEAIYLAHEGLSSTAFAFENLDQRAVYQNVAMMTLAAVHGIMAFRYAGREEESRKLFEVFSEQLLDFENAWQRHGLSRYGVEEKTWRRVIASHVDDSDLNVVARAARRVAARHLRAAGYRKEFDRADEHLATTTGHLWTHEVQHDNFVWESDTFCGLAEE